MYPCNFSWSKATISPTFHQYWICAIKRYFRQMCTNRITRFLDVLSSSLIHCSPISHHSINSPLRKEVLLINICFNYFLKGHIIFFPFYDRIGKIKFDSQFFFESNYDNTFSFLWNTILNSLQNMICYIISAFLELFNN